MEHIKLPNGVNMPAVGLGTWQADDEEQFLKALDAALDAGYRHFDTAYIYMNENVLGKAIKKWISAGKVKREDLFIVTKLPICAIVAEKVERFINKSLENLQLDYVDLYLVHCPFGLDSKSDEDPIPMKEGKPVIDYKINLEAVWKAMEQQVANGKAKYIGISNFDEEQIKRMIKCAKIKPANLQVEIHAYLQQKKLRELCQQHGISVTAYSPLGSAGIQSVYEKSGLPFQPSNMLSDPAVLQIAPRHGKTPAQILLRFLVQQGLSVIPKSTNPERLKQNIELFDFELSSAEMNSLEKLDKGTMGRVLDFSFLPGIENHPEFPKGYRK